MDIRGTAEQTQHTQLASVLFSLVLLVGFVPTASAAIGNGTTAGNLRTTAAVTPRIAGVDQASLVATDDLWDLSAEVDTIAGTRRAYWLYSDGTFVAGADILGADADALALLPAYDAAKSVLGVYIAGPLTDFDDAGGLAAQGTIADQVPDGAYVGVPARDGKPNTYVAPGPHAIVPV
jgi:hypothetical protein